MPTKPKKTKFSGPRKFKKFSRFQERVYQEVKKIPRGRTRSYGGIARKLKTSARAVGQALKKNLNPKIPCHRVICKNGKIGGYKGKPNSKLKKKLLEKEGVKI